MLFLQGEIFFAQFRTMTRRAFHLEVQDTYDTPEEEGPFRRFLDGQHDNLEWHQPWLELVRDVTTTGKAVERIRTVSIPHGDYTRWGLSMAPHNIEAGEDIRWLPRPIVAAGELPDDDFWLLDDDSVMFTIFEPDGRFAGGALTTDPSTVSRYCAVRDRLWAIAVPHAEYASDARLA